VGDFLKFLVDVIQFIWPFRIVHQWEVAGYYVFGRYKYKIGPGVYPIVPWFMDVKEISSVSGMVATPRQDITIEDGTLVSFSTSAWAKVIDYDLAQNNVYDYQRTTAETIQAVLADKIAQLSSDRLAPEKRGRLLSDLRRWVQEEAAEYGVEISRLRFTSFITRVRAHRFLMDSKDSLGDW